MGISAAVLLVTPEIAQSVVVRTLELPDLLELERNPAFTLAIGNTVTGPDGLLDYNAPDDLLQKARGTLGRINQYPARGAGALAAIARHMALRRGAAHMKLLPVGAERSVSLSVQTREVPHANTLDEAVLSIRLEPARKGRLPSKQGLRDLKQTLPYVMEVIGQAGVPRSRSLVGRICRSR